MESKPPNDVKLLPWDSSPIPKHYTREPLWVIPLAALITGLLPIIRFYELLDMYGQLGVFAVLGLFAGLGALAATLLVIRSYILSAFWAGCILWFSMLLMALTICAVIMLFIK